MEGKAISCNFLIGGGGKVWFDLLLIVIFTVNDEDNLCLANELT